MRFYKSFLFLFCLNFLFICPVWLFFDLRFLVPVFAFLFFLNLFLLFFNRFYFKKNFAFSFFAPEDAYGVHLIFEGLKTTYNLDNIQLLKVKHLSCSFFYFNGWNKSFVALSEDLLEIFSKEDIRRLLCYPFQMEKSGDLFFLTLLSNFIFVIEFVIGKLLYYLNYPLFLFRQKLVKKENLILVFVLRALSLMTKTIFYNLDKSLLSDKNENEKLAILLWRLHSLVKIKPPKVFPFMSPLFLTNPLTDLSWECYISLQPSIKERVESLGVSYPP